MSNLTLVLWLQSGRKFDEFQAPDRGHVERRTERLALNPIPRLADWRPAGADVLWEGPRIDRLVFTLTDPEMADHQYAVGRRRFHYRETSGWKTREELYEEACHARDFPHPRQELIDRITDQVAKHRALIEAGAFPVHSCALPGGCGIQQLLGVDCSKGAWAKAAPLTAAKLTAAKLDELYRILLNGGPLD
jgi:hypothetical protein